MTLIDWCIFQNLSKGLTIVSLEKNIRLALPTKLTWLTYPTLDKYLLSFEQSLLSPIKKKWLSGTINLFRFADANHQPSIIFQFHAPVSGNVEQSMAGSGSVVQSASFGNATAFRLYLSSGNINGIFTLYGVVK